MKRRNHRKEVEQAARHGSVWTSYSDMFTTMAIVFLVMFIFALIKVGVSTMERIAQDKAHQKELEGFVPKALEEKNSKQIAELKKSAEEVDEFENIINDKVLELNNLVKQMKRHKTTMQAVVKDGQTKDAILAKVQKEIADRKRELAILASNNDALEKDLSAQNKKLQTTEKEKEKVSLELLTAQNKLKTINAALKEEKNRKAEFQQASSALEKELKQITKANKRQIESLTADYQKQLTQLNSTIANITKQKEQTRNELTQTSKIRTELQAELSALKKSNYELERAKKQLSKQVENLDAKITISQTESSELSKKLNELIKNNRNLKEELKKANTQLSGLGEKNSGLRRELARMESQNKELMERNGGFKETIGQLRGEAKGLKDKNRGLSNELETARQEMASLVSDYNSTKGKLENAQGALSDAQSKIAKLEGENGKAKRSLANAEASNKSLTSKLKDRNQALLVCNEDYEKTEGQLNECNKIADGRQNKIDRLISSNNRLENKNDNLKKKIKSITERVENAKKNLRQGIAKKLKEQFKNNNIDASVNPRTGTVTLQMDRNLLFERNSAKLSALAKDLLKKIIPVYSKVLFSDADNKNKIAYFNIEGHASPSFSGEYVDPFSSDPTPYSYNMSLSGRRANSIAGFIFGNSIGKYENKLHMRKITRSIGMSFTKPIEKDLSSKPEVFADQLANANNSDLSFLNSRMPASTSRSDYLSNGQGYDCGMYDCSLSQRVELSFTLKDDPKIFSKITGLKEGDR